MKLNKALTGTIEVQALRDEDPEDKTTQYLASASLAWAVPWSTCR